MLKTDMSNLTQIIRYRQQLVQLEVKYRFEGLDPKAYIVQYRAILDRIKELEKEDKEKEDD